LYKVHQDAKYLPIKLNVPDYVIDGKKIPAVSMTASRDAAGKIHISLVNLDPHNAITISSSLNGLQWTKVTGLILTSANLTDINTFKQPEKLHLVNFSGAKKVGERLVVDLPAKSVITLELN
jgi:alpha-N-arabinofuranosidase